MTYTLEVSPISERRYRIVARFEGGRVFETSAVGTEEQVRRYAERVWIQRDLLRLHPELREAPAEGGGEL